MHITKEKTISNSLRKQTEPCGVWEGSGSRQCSV
jgi:hypothetical protein